MADMDHIPEQACQAYDVLGVIVRGRKRGIAQLCRDTICPLEEMLQCYISRLREDDIIKMVSRLDRVDQSREPQSRDIRALEQRYSDRHNNQSGIQLLEDIYNGSIEKLPREKIYRRRDPSPQNAYYVDFEGRKVRAFKDGKRNAVWSFKKLRKMNARRLEMDLQAEKLDKSGLLEAQRVIKEYLQRGSVVDTDNADHDDIDDLVQSAYTIMIAYKTHAKQVTSLTQRVSSLRKRIKSERKAFKLAVFVLGRGSRDVP